MRLALCSNCKRFARGDDACPFCGASSLDAPRARATGRRARNGVLAIAITAAACGGTTTIVTGDASSDGAPADAGADAKDDMAPIPFYGAVPLDSGKE